MTAHPMTAAIGEMAARLAVANYCAGVAFTNGQCGGKSVDHWDRASVRRLRAVQRLAAAMSAPVCATAADTPARTRTMSGQRSAPTLVIATPDMAVSARTSAPAATTAARVAAIAAALGVCDRTVRRHRAALRAVSA
ncbi:hypothetical protein Cs7R123_59560 [Catellatospora sp. TT07R-123]|uniref:hypothetical protein n=1 Tax=Catellatospora sp. TT07R-123 TaxID=2733863 RepID=UPI001B1631BE|nr:hypothetical protein [Catellatospora sp. TT07R-123]GHJ48614.1 hypothetical protein Cs7R123_59560 [Catellatospora sp. TT07R-123]